MDIKRFGNIVFIPGAGGARYPHCNSLFIDDEVKAVIDPGSDEATLRDLAAGRRIDVLLDTHYHEDHTAFNHLFPDAALWVHEAEAPCHRSYQTFLEYYGLRESPYRKEWDEFLIGKYHWRERAPSRALKDGDILEFGRTRAQVIHTPGHTVGHICLHFPDEGILFLADYDLTPFGPWYGDFCSGIDQTIESVNRLLTIPARIWITGHQLGIVEEGFEGLAEAYIDVIRRREEKLLDALESPLNLDEIVERWIIYGRERKPRYFFDLGEREMMRKHLERLVGSGRVMKKEDRYALS
jgi:glyoxylase-like metal-dependent hydrolase (beta-lactamase superfamily II)